MRVFLVKLLSPFWISFYVPIQKDRSGFEVQVDPIFQLTRLLAVVRVLNKQLLTFLKL